LAIAMCGLTMYTWATSTQVRTLRAVSGPGGL
jgi:hypothetical protein